ncbi:MAG: glycosyltransferase family 9 protein [Chloroflexia bacterium]
MSAARTRVRDALLRLTNPRLMWQVSRRRDRPIKRILVVRPDHLGDLLFATPALRRIREAFPDAHVTGLVGPWGRAMWHSNPDLDELKVLRFPGMAGGREGGLLAPYWLLRQEASNLEHQAYDLGMALRFDHWWGAALMSAARIPHRWGYDTPGLGEWLTNAVPYTPGRHEVEQNLALVEAVLQRMGATHATPLQIDRAKGIPGLRPPPGEQPDPSTTTGWLDANRRVVIHPGTMSANKLWTIEGWAEVASKLASEGWSVALTGSPQEKPLADAIASKIRNTQYAIRNLTGLTTNLSQLAWVLAQAHFVLGVDSGPLHIADALGKPTLHLYGPSDEDTWGPWGDPRKHRAFRAPGTRPTGRLEVGSNALEGGPEMRAIIPEMVLPEVEALKGEVQAQERGSRDEI